MWSGCENAERTEECETSTKNSPEVLANHDFQYLDVFLIGQLLRFCLTICDVFFSSLWNVFRDVAIKSALHLQKAPIILFENHPSLRLN